MFGCSSSCYSEVFFELAVLLGRLAKAPFYGYGLCNEHSHAGIKFNELGWLNLNLPPLRHKFQGIVEFQQALFWYLNRLPA